MVKSTKKSDAPLKKKVEEDDDDNHSCEDPPVDTTPNKPIVKALVGVSSSDPRFDADKMNAELEEINKLAEETKKAQEQNKITVDNWYVPFGKYKSLTGKSVLNIIGSDKKGNSIPVGRQYLAWMLNLDYLHQKDKLMISQLLSM